jgi:hypothetical protein
MFSEHVLTPNAFAVRFLELLPEYLPGMDTGAFEPTDRQRCWNKTLKSVLTVMGEEDNGLSVVSLHFPSIATLSSQSSLLWQHDEATLFAMTTGWGTRNDLEISLEGLEAFKCPLKLFVYTCSKWQDAVLDQIRAALLRYPYHIDGEQYLFMNLLGAENRFHLLSADMDRSGPAPANNKSLLRGVPGSPFIWSNKRNTQK